MGLVMRWVAVAWTWFLDYEHFTGGIIGEFILFFFCFGFCFNI